MNLSFRKEKVSRKNGEKGKFPIKGRAKSGEWEVGNCMMTIEQGGVEEGNVQISGNFYDGNSGKNSVKSMTPIKQATGSNQ